MIRLSLDWLVFNYLFLFLGGIFLIWIFHDSVRRFREAGNSGRRWKCRLCGLKYAGESNRDDGLSKCPDCAALNEPCDL